LSHTVTEDEKNQNHKNNTNILCNYDETIVKINKNRFISFVNKKFLYDYTIKNDDINLIYHEIIIYFMKILFNVKTSIMARKLERDNKYFQTTNGNFVAEEYHNTNIIREKKMIDLFT